MAKVSSEHGRDFGIKYSNFGADTKGHDVKAFGDTTGKYFFWDASANTLYIRGTIDVDGVLNLDDIALADNETLSFGTGSSGVGDVVIKWDGTNLLLSALADDELIEIGDSAATQKSFDLKWYGNEANGASYLYADASANLLYTTDIDIQLKDNDSLVFGTGAGATGDIQFKWDATNFLMTGTAASSAFNIGAAGNVINTTQHGTVTVGVDDTGYDVKFFGATSGKYFLWDESADSVVLSGVLQIGTTTTAALALGGGTTSTKLTTATADKNFGGFFTESTAASGDSRGLYWRHYLGGTIASTGYGDAIRAFCTVTGTGYSYASGLHATMQINTGATVTGSGAGLRATLAAEAASRTLAGKLSALHLCSDVGAGNTLPTDHAFIRCTDDNSVRLSNLLVMPNASNGTILAAHTDQAMTHSIKFVTDDGTVYYLMATTTATGRS